jgi:hypothetical protein
MASWKLGAVLLLLLLLALVPLPCWGAADTTGSVTAAADGVRVCRRCRRLLLQGVLGHRPSRCCCAAAGMLLGLLCDRVCAKHRAVAARSSRRPACGRMVLLLLQPGVRCRVLMVHPQSSHWLLVLVPARSSCSQCGGRLAVFRLLVTASPSDAHGSCATPALLRRRFHP